MFGIIKFIFFYQEFENERIFKVQTVLIREFFIIIVSIIINSLILKFLIYKYYLFDDNLPSINDVNTFL